MRAKPGVYPVNYNDCIRLPEDKRYEILDGELYVVPAPNTRHQRISKRLEVALILHAEQRGLGEVFDAPYDVIFSEENIVQPDLLFVSSERAGIVGELNTRGAPDLVIEILSPGTRGRDLEIKRRIYGDFGVQEYWMVDPEAAGVEVLVRGEAGWGRAGLYGKTDRLSSALLPDLSLPLDKIFAE